MGAAQAGLGMIPQVFGGGGLGGQQNIQAALPAFFQMLQRRQLQNRLQPVDPQVPLRQPQMNISPAVPQAVPQFAFRQRARTF